MCIFEQPGRLRSQKTKITFLTIKGIIYLKEERFRIRDLRLTNARLHANANNSTTAPRHSRLTILVIY